MKRILITGANSYIGTSFEKWVSQWPQQYKVDTLDLINDTWRSKSFEGYDVIYHVAGIAHIKQTEKNRDLYYKVNRDLAIEVARKAKSNGVKQFIFLSSMSVYGLSQGVITGDTIPNPNCYYGISKYEAEKKINDLSDKKFLVSIVRPPMVYGNNCKGNFIKLVSAVQKIRVFPIYKNKRSMIYIDNLSEFIRIVIDHEISDILYPQNKEFICTYDIIKTFSLKNNIFICYIPFLDLIINFLVNRWNLVTKVFGNLLYDKSLSDIGYDYIVEDNVMSIRKSL